MLRSLKDLETYTVAATDGDVGGVVNFLLDDQRWVVRYLVVATGGFFASREALISPVSFRATDWATQRFHLALTRDKIRDSPGVDTQAPVSRQHELDQSRYYGYPYYWGSSGVWGVASEPAGMASGTFGADPGVPAARTGDVHLRSAKEVRGYHIQGKDEIIGHVEDFIVDERTWEVRYLVIDTSNWGFGEKVLVSPLWATEVSWAERKVHLALTRQQIRDCPKWDPGAAVNRAYETVLYDYYGRPAYWESNPEPPAPVDREPSGSAR